MNREEFKKLAEEEFINNTMKHLDSALIFTYIQNLEQKVNNLQSKIDKANKILSKKYEEDKEIFKGDYDFKFILDFEEELLDILKEVENVKNN